MGIVDTDGAACVTAAFSFGMDTATRNYRIHAIQYDRLNEMGGPAGCLQFFTGATGTVNTFNWVAVATSTHLANQDYDVCVRRLADRCSICWSPIITGDQTPTQGTFGLSNGLTAADAVAKSGAGAGCAADAAAATMDSNDYIIIPNGIQDGVAAAVVVMGTDKLCVFTDGDERHAANGAVMAAKNEASAGVAGGTEPLGTMGFSLGFTQVAC